MVLSAEFVRLFIPLVPCWYMAVLLVRLLKFPWRLLEALFAAELVAGARAAMSLVAVPTAPETALLALLTAPATVFAALEAAFPMEPNRSPWAGGVQASTRTATTQSCSRGIRIGVTELPRVSRLNPPPGTAEACDWAVCSNQPAQSFSGWDAESAPAA